MNNMKMTSNSVRPEMGIPKDQKGKELFYNALDGAGDAIATNINDLVRGFAALPR